MSWPLAPKCWGYRLVAPHPALELGVRTILVCLVSKGEGRGPQEPLSFHEWKQGRPLKDQLSVLSRHRASVRPDRSAQTQFVPSSKGLGCFSFPCGSRWLWNGRHLTWPPRVPRAPHVCLPKSLQFLLQLLVFVHMGSDIPHSVAEI